MTNASVLLLNNTNEVLGEVTVKRAVRLLFSRKAEVVHNNGQLLHSAGNRDTKIVFEFPLPSIIRLLYYVVNRRKVVLTKKHVLLRDNYKCGYCSEAIDHANASVDHIQPRSRGGKSTWENLVACCRKCNGRKGNRTPQEAGMALSRVPKKPRYIPFVAVRRHTLPDEWIKYLNLYSIGIEEKIF